MELDVDREGCVQAATKTLQDTQCPEILIFDEHGENHRLYEPGLESMSTALPALPYPSTQESATLNEYAFIQPPSYARTIYCKEKQIFGSDRALVGRQLAADAWAEHRLLAERRLGFRVATNTVNPTTARGQLPPQSSKQQTNEQPASQEGLKGFQHEQTPDESPQDSLIAAPGPSNLDVVSVNRTNEDGEESAGAKQISSSPATIAIQTLPVVCPVPDASATEATGKTPSRKRVRSIQPVMPGMTTRRRAAAAAAAAASANPSSSTLTSTLAPILLPETTVQRKQHSVDSADEEIQATAKRKKPNDVADNGTVGPSVTQSKSKGKKKATKRSKKRSGKTGESSSKSVISADDQDAADALTALSRSHITDNNCAGPSGFTEKPVAIDSNAIGDIILEDANGKEENVLKVEEDVALALDTNDEPSIIATGGSVGNIGTTSDPDTLFTASTEISIDDDSNRIDVGVDIPQEAGSVEDSLPQIEEVVAPESNIELAIDSSILAAGGLLTENSGFESNPSFAALVNEPFEDSNTINDDEKQPTTEPLTTTMGETLDSDQDATWEWDEDDSNGDVDAEGEPDSDVEMDVV
ncbi:hypothetical protein MIND_01183600 [Mycena indigotica]|uniref:Uncharacterized protein n=1 Tax=Mycena indigotica TaxID=2126181 RepID=A0A8H6VUW7_9AGAR|nr:uncharacterized protein MIND_01183600 [Mycena indigotica]KAF7292846.1 hypothetical protein MIND_01183600 [Mycena indigotica]